MLNKSQLRYTIHNLSNRNAWRSIIPSYPNSNFIQNKIFLKRLSYLRKNKCIISGINFYPVPIPNPTFQDAVSALFAFRMRLVSL